MSTIKKDLDYYKNLPYKVIIEKEEYEGESWFIAYANELGKYACYGRGDTEEEALQSFREEKDAFIEYLYKAGKKIPEPEKQQEKFSGTFSVRTSSALHARLVFQAREMNISLNQYLNQILAAAAEHKAFEQKISDQLAALASQIRKHHSAVTTQLHYQEENINRITQYPSGYSGVFTITA